MDRPLLIVQAWLAVLGVVGVAAAAPDLATEHAGRVVFAFVVTLVVARIPVAWIVKASPAAYLAVLASLVLVLIVGVGPNGSTATRWILVGNVAVQPSEFMKVAVIAYLAAFFHNHLGNWEIWRPMVVVGLATGLILVQPDVSTAAFLFTLAAAVMVAAGTTLLRLASIGFAAVTIALVVAGPFISDLEYVTRRLDGFRDARGAQEAVSTESYQAYRARIALESAGWLGVGVSSGVAVPEAETDMIAVAIGRSMGLVGVVGLIACYLVVALRGLAVAARVTGPASLLAAGATAYVCGQAAVNLLVASGSFPITGIPLPFVSYGLNSLVSVAVAFGMVHGASLLARRREAEARVQANRTPIRHVHGDVVGPTVTDVGGRWTERSAAWTRR